MWCIQTHGDVWDISPGYFLCIYAVFLFLNNNHNQKGSSELYVLHMVLKFAFEGNQGHLSMSEQTEICHSVNAFRIKHLDCSW